jgi:lysyl-tRNA synthetase class 1
LEAKYLFGVDDYDPLDEIPAGKGAHFEQYLGQPLCNVPPPDGSSATDMAEHYMSEFWGVFEELGVKDARHLPLGAFQCGHRHNLEERRHRAPSVQGSIQL